MKSLLLMFMALLAIAPASAANFAVPAADPRDTLHITRVGFESDKGTYVLEGKPLSTASVTGGSHSKWVCEGRVIDALLQRSKHGYTLSLKAAPSAGIIRWHFQVMAEPDEFFTGVMERVVDGEQSASWRPGITEAMNLRGQKIDCILKPTTSVYSPFYLSSRGYGLFVRGTWPGEFDFCKSSPDAVKVAFEGPSLQLEIYVNSHPAEIIKAHAADAGLPVQLPKWAFSPWRWRDDHANNATYYDGTPANGVYNTMLVEDMLMMKALDIPCGVYWVDRPWATGDRGYDDFNWDTKRFPNPERMIKWLGEQNTKFVLWIAPWVMGDMAKEAVAKDYSMKKASRTQVLVDFTNPEAKKWWQEKGLKKVLDIGVAGFKLDRAEEGIPEDYVQKAYDGRTTRETRNDYPHQYVQATYEICKKVRGDDFALLPRAAYTGSSQYAAFWGGDIGPSEWGLRASVIAAQRSAVMGYPLWGSDTGGYHRGVQREVMMRWLAFSCFCPIMEVGPTDNRAPWDMPEEPKYDTELLAVWRTYAKLHTKLMDYTSKHAAEAHKTGMPVIRPLFVAYPNQKEAWADWQTYLYGPDILVSVVWRTGATTHDLYLPAGQTWVNAWDGKEYKGGCKVTVESPVYRMPIFTRKGSHVSLGDLEGLHKESLAKVAIKPDLANLQKSVK